MIEFTQETWRERAAAKLGEMGLRLKEAGRRDAPYVAYGTLAGLAVWPLVEQAAATGQLAPVLGALYTTAAGVGANLIASQVERWKDRAERPAEAEVVAWAADEAGNAELRAALDAIVEKLEAIPTAIAALPPAEQPDFRAALLSEMAQLGNRPHFEQVITGGGAFIVGDASAARDFYAGAKTVGGHEIHDSVINAPVLGAGASLTQVIQDPRQPDPVALRDAYLNRVWQTTAFLSLGGVDPRAAADAETRLDLAAVYTALLTESERLEKMSSREMLGQERRRRSAVEELNRHKRLVLLGEPGSGKSTLAAFVALCLSGEALAHPITNLALLTAPLPDDQGDDEEERQPWRHGPLLPVLVVLRDLAATGLPPADQPASAETLWSFLQQRLEKESLGEYTPHLRRDLRERGGLVLFDGLDEVPEADSRRVQIKQIVESFAASFPSCRIVITSRTYAYQNQDWRLPDFAEAVLAPFSAGQIRRFVARWYGYIGRLRHLSTEDALGRGQLLQDAIFGSDRLMGLAERPLLLTLMASLHAWHGGTLPEKREELYHESVNMLLDWWERQRLVRDAAGNIVNPQPSLAEWLNVDRDRVREWLNELAFTAHSRQPELAGTADIAEKELVDGLLALSDEPNLRPKLLVQYLSHRAGLLVPHGVGVYTFPHRTFQEYLAACHLTDHDYPEQVARLACADLNRWREVALLAAAKVVRGGKFAVWPLLDELCPEGPEEAAGDAPAARGALLAGQVVLESADRDRLSAGNRPKVERVRRWQKTLLAHPALPDGDRAVAGRSLAELGDDRPEVRDVDAMHFCLVPGGPFRMGSDERDEEKPIHTVEHLTYDYWLGRYPVTNAQFETFAGDGGYDVAEYWREAAEAGRWSKGAITDWSGAPRIAPYDYGRPFNLPNHPVIGITWYEALAFARWLTDRWRASSALPAGWEVRLPSEAEWEKGARGGLSVPAAPVIRAAGRFNVGAPALVANPQPERRHPWVAGGGPGRANTAESAINAPGAAGLFPAGAGPYGCEEMSGTVWEWTRSLWGDHFQKPSFGYPYRPDDGRENLSAGVRMLRILRGGSYYNDVDACRCAQRDGYDPHFRFDYYGVRVLVAPSGHL